MNDEIISIVTTAINAPSGDNSQPWHFAFANSVLKIWCEPGKDHPRFNVDNRGTYIAHGALIENIRIAAAHHHFATTVALFPEASDPELVAAITFAPDQSVEYFPELYEAISHRCTNRKRYDRQPLTSAEAQALASIPPIDGVRVIIAPHESVSSLSTPSSSGEYVMIHNPELRNLLFNDVRWTVEEERKVQSGLLVKTLELLPPQEMVFKLMQKPWIARVLVALGMPTVIAKDNASVYATSSCYVALVIPQHSAQSYIAVGRMMELLWLTATKLGLAAHPVTGTIFIHQSIEKDGASFLSDEERSRIEDSYKSLYTILRVESGHLGMLVRMGHAPEPSARCSKKAPQIVFET